MSQNKGLSKTLYKWPQETNGYGGPEKMRHIFLETLETQVLDRSSLLIWWYLLAWLFYPVVIPSNKKNGAKVMKYAMHSAHSKQLLTHHGCQLLAKCGDHPSIPPGK